MRKSSSCGPVHLLLLSVLAASATSSALGSASDQAPKVGGTNAPKRDIAEMGAREFRYLEVSGEEVDANVSRVTSELHWYRKLRSALDSGRRQSKPVLWIQALGDIDGFL